MVLRRLSIYFRKEGNWFCLISHVRFLGLNPTAYDDIMSHIPSLEIFKVCAPWYFSRTFHRSSKEMSSHSELVWNTVQTDEFRKRGDQFLSPHSFSEIRVVYLNGNEKDLSEGNVLGMIRRRLTGVHSVFVQDRTYLHRRTIYENAMFLLQAIPPIAKLYLPRRSLQFSRLPEISNLFDMCPQLQELHLHEKVNRGACDAQIRSIAMSVEAENLPAFLNILGKYCRQLVGVYVEDAENHRIDYRREAGFPHRPLKMDVSILENANMAVDRFEACVPSVNVSTLRSMIQLWSLEVMWIRNRCLN